MTLLSRMPPRSLSWPLKKPKHMDFLFIVTRRSFRKQPLRNPRSLRSLDRESQKVAVPSSRNLPLKLVSQILWNINPSLDRQPSLPQARWLPDPRFHQRILFSPLPLVFLLSPKPTRGSLVIQSARDQGCLAIVEKFWTHRCDDGRQIQDCTSLPVV